MPANNAGKASPGSPFVPPPAVIWNNMVDAGRAWADGQLNNGAPTPNRPRATDLIRIKNDCGANRERGEILLISGKAITDLAEESIWLLGDTPTANGYFAILKQPIQSGEVGTAQVSGCCLATIDVIDIDHTRAKPSAGDYVLESSTDGPIEIIYSPGLTGEQECVVRFGSSGGGGSGGGLIIKTPGGGIAGRNITSDVIGKATCTIYDVNGGDQLIATSDTIEVCNISSQPVAGNRFGMAKLDTTSGRWLIDFEDCL